MTARPQPRLRLILCLIAAVVALPGLASRASAAGLLVADGPFGGALDLRDHDVRVVINNGIAVKDYATNARILAILREVMAS